VSFVAGSEPGDVVEIKFDDAGSADALARELEAAITKAMGVAAKSIASALNKAMGKGSAGGGFAKSASTFQRNVTNAVNTATKAMGNLQNRINDVDAALRRVGGPQAEFDTLIRLSHVAAESFDDLRAARERAARDPGFARIMIAEVEAAQKSANTQQRSALKLTDVAETEFKKRSEAQRIADQVASQQAKREAAERIVTLQTEAAREVALTKSAAQRRVEVMRFAANQIRALERGLAAIFRGTAGAIAGAFRGLGRGLGTIFSGISSRLKRSNAEMATGIDSALDKRESLLRSSFHRQEEIVSRSVRRQEILNQRLDTRLSTGVLGAATGRSRVGAALGLGAAFSGGFAIVGALRNMIGAAQDFEQGLAVLQAQLQLSDKQMERVRATAIELGNDISLPGVSAKDAADAINLLTKQFGALGKGAVPAAQKAAKGVLQLSRATGSSAEDSAQVVGTAINVFGINAAKAVSVADQITGALTKAAGVGFGDFSLAFKQAATVFAQFQVPAVGAGEALVDFNTAIAVLARGGLVGSDAGTSLKQFFLQANRGTADSVKNLKMLTERAGETGTAFFDASGKARPLAEALGIMREGLQGLTDQERNKTLQKIFGSDAIRAANILLGTSQKTFDTIEEGVRRSGVAAEIAAAQNTGLRGAMDALNSVVETQIILIWRPLNKILGNVVLSFANFFNLILTADSGPFKIIRDGLKGIAVGLAAVLAVKTAVEVIRLLGPAISGLLTPFGLIAVAAATIGAAFFILRDNSAGFRDALSRAGDVLSDLAARLTEVAAPLIDFLRDRWQQLVDFFTGTVGPGLEKVGTGIGNTLVFGLQKLADFITNTVIPGVKAFIDFIPELLRAVGRFFVRAWNTARDAVVSFWDKVEPIIRPAIDGFKRFGDALADLIFNFNLGDLARIGGVLAATLGGFAVGGPIGAIIAGAASSIALLFGDSLGKGLVDTLGNIGGLIADALKGPLDAIKEFLGDFFTVDNLKSVVAAVLDLVEQVGFIIGNIVTDPRVIGVIAGLAALAATAAFRFVQGLIEGLKDNLPEWGRLLLTGLKQLAELALKGLAEVFKSPTLLLGIFGGLVAAGRIVSLFRQAGQNAGQSFFQGFRQVGFSGAFSGGGAGTLFGSGGAFITGLLGSPGTVQSAVDRELQRTTGAVAKRVSEMRSVLRIAGQDIIGPRTLSEVTRQFNALEKTLGPSGIAGLRIRAAVKATFESLRTLSLDPLRALGKGTIGAMTTIGKNMAGALAAGFAGFQTGKALAGQSVIEQLLGVGGLALAVGAVNVPAGIAAGAAGLLGIAFGNMGQDAEEAAARVRDLAAALVEADDPMKVLAADLLTRFGELAPGVQEVFDALKLGIGDLQGSASDVTDTIFSTLLEQVPEITTLLQEAGVPLSQFHTLVAQGMDFLPPDQRSKMQEVVQLLEDQGFKLEDINAAFGFATQAAVEYGDAQDTAARSTRFFNDDMDSATRKAADAHSKFQEMAGATEDAGKKGETAGERLRRIFANIPGFLGSTLDRGLGLAKDAIEDLQGAADTTIDKIKELFNPTGPKTLQQGLDDLILSLPGLASQIESVLFPPEGTTVSTQFLEATKNNVGSSLATALSEIVIPQIQLGKITSLKGVDAVITQVIDAIKAEMKAGTIDEAVGVTMIAELQEVTLDPKFRRQLQRQIDRFETIQTKIKIRGQLEGEGLKPREINSVMRQLFGEGTPGRPRQVRGFPGITVQVPIRGVPKGKPLTLKQIVEAVQASQRRQRLRAQRPIEVEIPFKPVPKAQAIPKQDLIDAILTGVTGGPQGFGGGVPGHAAEVRGIDTQNVDVPISITPVVSVAATSGADAAKLGQSIAALVAVGVASASGTISNALGNAIAGALRGGAAATAGFARAGEAIATALARGIESEAGATASAGQAIATTAVIGAATGVGPMAGIGSATGSAYAGGVSEASGAAFSAGASLGSAARTAAQGFSLFSTGLAMAQGLADGILAGKSTVIAAAESVAQAGIDAAKRKLGVSSPSRVFRNLGRDVGKGFVLGLEDSQGDIASAMQQAVDDAIAAAQAAVPRQGFARAVGARALFEATQPAGLPGGPTNADVMRALIDVRQSIADFHRDLLDEQQQARRDQKDREQALLDKLEEVRKATLERIEARAAARFGGGQAGIDIRRERINLAGIGRDLFEGLTESMLETRKDAEGNEVKIRHKTLDTSDRFGRANANVILDQLQRVRDFGQQLIESGRGARSSVKEMKQYRDALVKQAVSMGFNREQVQQLVQTMGLSDDQLARYVERLRDANEADKDRLKRIRDEILEKIRDSRETLRNRLERSRDISTTTEAGRRNRQAILDSLQAIRDWGSAALEAGTPVARVVDRMRELRENLIRTARQAGLPIDQIRQLIQVMGLSNAQIAEFVRQLEAMRDAIPDVPTPPDTASPTTRLPGPLVGAINITVPYGDPEAIGLAVANRVAFFAA
jgi:TP901 family phage tail tape measure protein